MKKIVTLFLITAVFSLGLPFSTFAAEEMSTHDVQAGTATTTPETEGKAGVIAAAVSVLGFIALAASVDAGDVTPASTTTTHH